MYLINIFNKRFTLLIATFLLTSFSLFAHFGQRSPLGGTVNTAISYNGIVYLGTAEGGVFETTSNQITTWRARPVGLLSGKITALAHSGSYLFAGTADDGVYIFNGYVSADRYWNRINTGITNLQIKSLVAVDSITVLAGTNGGGLFKTVDKGANWTAIDEALINNSVVTGLVNAGTRIILTTLDGGVFASDDAGNTWIDFNDANTLNIGGTSAISYNATTDVLAVLNSNGLFAVASASTAGTATYASVLGDLPSGTQIRAISNNGTGWYLATDAGIFTTVNSGINWLADNSGLGNVDATAVVALPTTIVAAIRKEGIYKTDATTISWGLTNAGFNNMVTHSVVGRADSTVVAVTEDGVWVSSIIGTSASYVKSNTGLTDSLNVNDIIFAENYLVAATTNDGVFWSADLGANWASINNGLSDLNIVKLFYANDKLYAISASGNLYASDLSTTNWVTLETGITNGAIVTSLAFSGNNILLGTLGNGVFHKDHFATTWADFNTGLTNLNVTSVTASAGKFYAGTDGDGVFISEDSTATWTATASTNTAIPHTALMGLDGNKIQAMESYAGYVYASYKGGLLTTSDEGAIWEQAGNQFNLPSFTNVNKISFVSTRVFVTTDNNGPYANGLAELPVLTNFIDLSDYVFNVPAAANTNYISVTSNIPWVITSNDSWLSASIASGIRNGNFSILADNNTGLPRTGTLTVTSDSLAQSFTITVNQDGTTGLGEESNPGISVYPNPFGNEINVSGVEAGSTISLSDVTGRIIQTTVSIGVNGKAVVNTANLDKGIYLISIAQNGKVITSKRVIKTK